MQIFDKLGNLPKLFGTVVVLILSIAVVGCGGGGGGSSASTAPVANAGPDQVVPAAATSTTTVTLAGTSSDSNGAIVAHQWTQIPTGSAAVALNGSGSPTTTFDVNETTDVYTFNYTVTDNEGLQSTDTVSVFTAEIYYLDTFSANFDNWTPVDDTGNGDSWSVSGSQLNQTSNTIDVGNLDNSFDSNSSYHLGTYARLDSPSISGSYRFSVDITPVPDFDDPLIASDNLQSSDVGIMFGYSDGDNYYRVSLNARYGFTRFEKRSGGAFETLAVSARGYVENQTMTLTAEINGNAIVVWIDGDPTFAYVDSNPLSGTVALYCQDGTQFDNVVITENPLQPVVAIASPLAYSIASTRDNGSVLSTRSVLLNMPTGGDLLLSLDGSQVVANPVGNVYTRNFFGVAAGEHEFAAIIRYADGEEANADINSTVGTGGDYYVSVGDSITNGVGDNNPSNNDSIDGRIVASQGFQAPLADALWTADRPVIVFNEGIPGDRAADLELRAASILERHPSANRVLMLIGTNDSGSGVTPGVFNTTVSDTAASIIVDGKQVWLAEILPTRDDPSRNALIEQFNTEIRSIAASSGDDIFLGPDFYDAFTNASNVPISAYYTDNLHPNDTGYAVMASQWNTNLP